MSRAARDGCMAGKVLQPEGMQEILQGLIFGDALEEAGVRSGVFLGGPFRESFPFLHAYRLPPGPGIPSLGVGGSCLQSSRGLSRYVPVAGVSGAQTRFSALSYDARGVSRERYGVSGWFLILPAYIS